MISRWRKWRQPTSIERKGRKEGIRGSYPICHASLFPRRVKRYSFILPLISSFHFISINEWMSEIIINTRDLYHIRLFVTQSQSQPPSSSSVITTNTTSTIINSSKRFARVDYQKYNYCSNCGTIVDKILRCMICHQKVRSKSSHRNRLTKINHRRY
jgi:hypothetical protein